MQAERQQGQQAGVNATPTFFAGGQKIEGAASYDQLHQLVARLAAVPQPSVSPVGR